MQNSRAFQLIGQEGELLVRLGCCADFLSVWSVGQYALSQYCAWERAWRDFAQEVAARGVLLALSDSQLELKVMGELLALSDSQLELEVMGVRLALSDSQLGLEVMAELPGCPQWDTADS